MAHRRRDRWTLGTAYSLPEAARRGPEVDLPVPDPVLAWVQFPDRILEIEARVLAHTESAVLVEWGFGQAADCAWARRRPLPRTGVGRTSRPRPRVILIMKTVSRFSAITLAAVTLAAITGCSASGPVEGTKAPTAAAATPTPTAKPEAQVGTRENPFPVGTPGKYSDDSMWTVTWKETNPDAWAVVHAANEYNDAPVAGSSFVLGTFNVAAAKSEDGEPASAPQSLGISFVGSDGNTYSSSEGDCGVIPGSNFRDLGDMYAGAYADASVCAQVPTAAVAGGSWRVESLSVAGTYSFFKTA